jgi:hypothetical protein
LDFQVRNPKVFHIKFLISHLPFTVESSGSPSFRKETDSPRVGAQVPYLNSASKTPGPKWQMRNQKSDMENLLSSLLYGGESGRTGTNACPTLLC